MGIYEELDEARAEIEKLKANYQMKLELSESLKKAHNEQLMKIQEAGLKSEKLSQQLNDMAEELSAAKLMSEELKLNLKEKESLIKHLTSANDKLRADCKEKLQRCEEDNRGLGLALDEASAKNLDQEKQIRTLREEIEGLKGFVSVSQNKCSEADIKGKVSRDARQKDDTLLNLEEERNKYENQLKWKKEQFGHLQEAHEKLKSEFRVKEKEWEKEKAVLFDDISSLQANLDSQKRISESLKSRLDMCNHALSHEESKRKRLEVELFESKAQFDNVFTEYEEAKSKIESLTGERDKDIASLRNTLGTKEGLYKEMEYQVRMLELEKQDLMSSLKQLQETQIQEAGSSSSLAKLRNKLRGLEQVHKDCHTRLKDKETEWSSQVQNLMQKLNCCFAELENEKMLVEKLKMEAEARDSTVLELALHKEEAMLMLLILKSEFLEGQQKLCDAYNEIYQENNESRKRLARISTQLDMKNGTLIQAQKDIEKEHKKVIHLSEMVESFNFIEEKQLSMVKEVERQRELLHESDACARELKKKLLNMESELNEVRSALHEANQELDEKFCEGNEFELQIWKCIAQQLKTSLEEDHQMHRKVQASLRAQLLNMRSHLMKLCNAIDNANDELAVKFCELNEVEFELQIWKSIAEQLKRNLEENHHMRKEVETSLLAQVAIEVDLKHEKDNLLNLLEDKDKKIDDLQQQLISLDRKLEMGESGSIPPATSENVKHSTDLQEEEEWMKKELEGAILAQIDAERNYEHEKESLHQIVEERDQKIDDLQQLVKSLEQEFQSSISSFSSRLSNMQVEINFFHESWDKVVTVMVLKEMEIQEKNLIVAETQDDLTKLEVECQAKQLEVESLTHKLEKLNAEKCKIFDDMVNLSSERETLFEAIEGLSVRLEQELNRSDILVGKFNAEKGRILKDVVKLSSERENFSETMEGLYGKLDKLSREDIQLMEKLANMVQSFDSTEPSKTGRDEFLEKENTNTCLSSPVVTKAAISDGRLPLRALNRHLSTSLYPNDALDA
ncbi:hypothetical protein M9H77_19610 [Catharanthus roseus]|uniref:Uncharacterized protein n=1 Tax=Catharanthus roseus TaxID=4058 RepID=A0ACC0BAW9_CATRO|nr:hypothetical protein M9H77_19610 [Catharanthus roseus]